MNRPGSVPQWIVLLLMGAGWFVACARADSDFAVSVLSYEPGTTFPWPDYLDDEEYNNPSNALGGPTVDTTSDTDPFTPNFGRIALGETVPVVPVFSPFRSFELVSIGSNGHLAVAFDHRVLDDPANPYGSDFIVFGNVQFGSSSSWSNRHPDHISISDTLFPQEFGEVAVSQDGTNWFPLIGAPYADHAFAPTLGRIYDPDNVDTNVGDWNQWWAGPTDPTFPVDPSVVISNLDGLTVTELVQRYGRSAGGTSFDISTLPLSLDPTNGVKWIQYIKVENNGSYTPEIDAFADVAPVSPSELWTLEQFDWLTDPTNTLDDADPDGDGLNNLFEYGVNRNPDVFESDPLYTVEIVTTSTPPRMMVTYERNTQAVDVVVSVQQSSTLPGMWSTNGVNQDVSVNPGTNGSAGVTAELPMDQGACFINLNVERP